MAYCSQTSHTTYIFRILLITAPNMPYSMASFVSIQ
jgi:hypothetical protein